MKYCTSCGTPNEGNTNFCSNCGQSLVQNANVAPVNMAQVNGQVYYGNSKNGKSTASMVLGIIALVYSIIILPILPQMDEVLVEAMSDGDVTADSIRAAAIIMFCTVNFICGILGLIFGLVAKKNGKAIAGIITSSLSIIMAVITTFVIMSVEL